MTERLDQYVANTFSQFGEDGCIKHIFEKVGEGSRVAVEFGAGDGMSCSNTAVLWHDAGWTALLIEADPARFGSLEDNTKAHGNAICRRAFITPTGPESISAHITGNGLGAPDLLSIDIDGDDYFILEALTLQPRVICIEFNPTIPPHIEMRQSDIGSGFGASLVSIIRLGERSGYTFIGATYCNAFLVRNEEADRFPDYLTDPSVLFPPTGFTYAVTDYGGRLVLVGQPLPWQAKDPMIEQLESSAHITAPSTDIEYITRAFERVYGPAISMPAAGMNPHQLRTQLLVHGPSLVCIDLTNGTLPASDWIDTGRDAGNYHTRQVGNILAFIKNG